MNNYNKNNSCEEVEYEEVENYSRWKDPQTYTIIGLIIAIIVVVSFIVVLHSKAKENEQKAETAKANTESTVNYVLDRGEYLTVNEYLDLKKKGKIKAYDERQVDDTEIVVDLVKSDDEYLIVPYDVNAKTIKKPSLFGDKEAMERAVQKFIEQTKLNSQYPKRSFIQKNITVGMNTQDYIRFRDSLNLKFTGDVVIDPLELDEITVDFIKSQESYVSIYYNEEKTVAIKMYDSIESARQHALDYNDELIKSNQAEKERQQSAKKEQDKLKKEQEEAQQLKAQEQKKETSNKTESTENEQTDEYTASVTAFVEANTTAKYDFEQVASSLTNNSQLTSPSERLKVVDAYTDYAYKKLYAHDDVQKYNVFLKNLKNNEQNVNQINNEKIALALLMMARFETLIQDSSSTAYSYSKGFYDIKRQVYTGAYDANNETILNAVKSLNELGEAVQIN